MKQSLFIKLAGTNVKKNRETFFPFIISIITMVATFYMLSSIWFQSMKGNYAGALYIHGMLNFGVIVTGILCMGIVFYTNSFLMKKRTKELGLYHVLGLEKRHIGCVLFWEVIMVGTVGTVLGLISGLVFSRLFYMLLLKLIHAKKIEAFGVSPLAVLLTVMVFGCVFLLMMVYNRIRLIRMKAVDMLQSTKRGEKEPKAKWILALLGLVCLGIGYYIAQTTNNPMSAMGMFFVAVMFVIVGTYFLFVASSIAILKLLKKNKNYYYHKTHFITVSDMMYRMKQNAVGLANICIFSTIVIVTLSTTVSLYIGLGDEMKTRYPQDIMCNYKLDESVFKDVAGYKEKVARSAAKLTQDKKLSMTSKNMCFYYDFVGVQEKNKFEDYNRDVSKAGNKELMQLTIMTVADYNSGHHGNLSVPKGKILLSEKDGDTFPDQENTFYFGREAFPVKKLNSTAAKKVYTQDYCNGIVLLVKDDSAMIDIHNKLKNKTGIQLSYNYNLKGDVKTKKALGAYLQKNMYRKGANEFYVDDYYAVHDEVVSMYASLLFIGIFIGMLFLIATVLIIYYKQISEGYEDRNNFIIMQNVGMDKREVKKIINHQILSVFFLPIAMAIVHIVFAFHIIKQLLQMFNLQNIPLFIGCTTGTIVVFLLFYTLVYRMTSRVYYRIVNQ